MSVSVDTGGAGGRITLEGRVNSDAGGGHAGDLETVGDLRDVITETPVDFDLAVTQLMEKEIWV